MEDRIDESRARSSLTRRYPFFFTPSFRAHCHSAFCQRGPPLITRAQSFLKCFFLPRLNQFNATFFRRPFLEKSAHFLIINADFELDLGAKYISKILPRAKSPRFFPKEGRKNGNVFFGLFAYFRSNCRDFLPPAFFRPRKTLI